MDSLLIGNMQLVAVIFGTALSVVIGYWLTRSLWIALQWMHLGLEQAFYDWRSKKAER